MNPGIINRPSVIQQLFLVISLAILTQWVSGQELIHLWPGNVPGETDPKHPAITAEDTAGRVIRLADVTDPVLEVYRPECNIHPDVCVIVCPGGAYYVLAIDKEGYEIARWLNTLGITAFVLQYRVPQKQEGALQDLQRAIRLARSLCMADNTRFSQVGVIGFSAGGSLCARASTRFNNRTYPPVDLADSLSCRPDFSILIYPAYLDLGPGNSLTPELTLSADCPPFFIFGTADDRYGNSSLVMTSNLRNARIPVELHFLTDGGHGYGLRPGKRAAESWPVLAHKWMINVVFHDRNN